jgi:hypothetical protein
MLNKLYFKIVFALPLVACILFASAQNGSLRGTITDAKTGEALIGVTVRLENTSLGAITDLDGKYFITNIPPKSYNILASYIGYKTQTKFNIVVRSEGNPDVNFKLEESSTSLGEIVVRSNPFEKISATPLSIQKLSQEEVAAYPGGNNDIAKVVQSLPGVSGSVGGFRNDVIIRGGAPNENVYYLDGVEIPSINHFSTQGSAGGPVGLLNVSFFEGVTLSSSAFGAQYDNVLSGVLQFDQRNGNNRKMVTNLRVSSSEAALTLEGPLFKGKKEEAKTTYIASVRRSYLQLLFQVIGLPFLPDYWDYQYKINHKINDYNDIYITAVGAIDDLEINKIEDFSPEQQAIQDQIPVIGQYSSTLGVGWRKRFKDNSGFMRTTVSTNYLKNEFRQFDDNINQTGLYLQNNSVENEYRLRYSLTKYIGKWTNTFGLVVVQGNYQTELRNLIFNQQFNTDLSLVRYGAFAQTSTKFFQDRLGFSMGIRTDGNSFTNTGNELWRTLSPRAAVSYKLNKIGNWTANASIGRYFKILPYTTLGFKDNNDEYINRSAEYITSNHVVAGIEHLLSRASRITIEGFYKYYENYPVSVIDQISLANKGGGFEVFGSEPITSDGEGQAYGVELLYQQKLTQNFYAVTSFTFYKSEFTNGVNDNFIPAVWDNGILISLLGGYKFGNNWEISSRYRFLGRTPYAPIDEAATFANYPAVIRDYSRLGSVELDPFSQWDIRIDKKWNFKKWSLDLFLDVQNVLGQQLPAEPSFGLDRDEQGNVIEPRSLIQIPAATNGAVLPSLGIVVNI